MSTALVPHPGLGEEVVGHLDAQIASAQRLLEAVLSQGQAIRVRKVEEVLARLGDIQAEMGRRAALEAHRAAILSTAGTALGLPPHAVTLEALSDLLDPAQATVAAARSAQLRGLLAEVTREHAINRALMRQELAFLDHLMRELGAEPDTGYSPPSHAAGGNGLPAVRARFRTLDLEA